MELFLFINLSTHAYVLLNGDFMGIINGKYYYYTQVPIMSLEYDSGYDRDRNCNTDERPNNRCIEYLVNAAALSCSLL